MPRFNIIIFYQYKPKIKSFLQKKIQSFRALRARHSDLRASGSCELFPQTPSLRRLGAPAEASFGPWLRHCVMGASGTTREIRGIQPSLSQVI